MRKKDKNLYKAPRSHKFKKILHKIFMKCMKLFVRLLKLCMIILILLALLLSFLSMFHFSIPWFNLPFLFNNTASSSLSSQTRFTVSPTNTFTPAPTKIFSTTKPTSIPTLKPTSAPTLEPTSTPTLKPTSTPAPTSTITIAAIHTPTPNLLVLPTPTINPIDNYSSVAQIAIDTSLIKEMVDYSSISSDKLFTINNISFYTENQTFYINSEIYLVEFTTSIDVLNYLASQDIRYINIQDFYTLNIYTLIECAKDYDVTKIYTIWEKKNNSTRYKMRLIMEQNIWSILLKGICNYDLTH